MSEVRTTTSGKIRISNEEILEMIKEKCKISREINLKSAQITEQRKDVVIAFDYDGHD